MTAMWALSPQTEGCACGLGDAAADALCKVSVLQSLAPSDLALALRVSVGKAQDAINRVASIASDGRKIPQGVSLDRALATIGHAARPTNVLFAPDAAALPWMRRSSANAGEIEVSAKDAPLWGLALMAVIGAVVVGRFR